MSTRVIGFRGFRWGVYESPVRPLPADTRAPASSRALYFLSRIGSRRSDAFPDNWASLSERELALLCARARSIGERAAFEVRGDGAERVALS